MIGIAAAPDFTEDLMWEAMTPPERDALTREGVLHVPSEYGDPYPVTRQLIEDGHDTRSAQGLVGHKDTSTAMIYTQILNGGGKGVRSATDRA